MPQNLSNTSEQPGAESADELSRAGSARNAATERWPTPGEVLSEAGLVLAGALGLALAMNVLLAFLGIHAPI